MSFKIRNAVGLAFLLALITSMTVLAKGGFSFISITGPDIDEEVRATDLKLTEDFFAFADFYRDRVETPKDPGQGYEITRYYIDGKREIAFDQLHYYPMTGFVFYDGIVNGDSEYDGEWYSANPAIKTVLESVLPAAKAPPVQQLAPVQPAPSVSQPVASLSPSQLIMLFALAAGLVVLAMMFRKPSIQ